MQFFTDEHLMLRDAVREFALNELAPRASEIEENHIFPAENMAKMAELGFLGAHIPEKYGGAGMDFTSFVIIMEEVSRVCGSTGITLAAHSSLCAYPLFKFGSEEQKRKFLPDICSGRKLGAFGLTEAEAGSDAGATKTTAVRKDDHWVINGSKMFCTNGSKADLIVIVAKTDLEAPSSHGISSFIIEKGFPGFTVGKDEDKLGLRGSVTTQLFFENCQVPAENLMGVEGEGFKHFMETLDEGRVVIGVMALGIAQGAFDEALKYSKQREAFGHPIAKLQTIQGYLADMAMQLEAGRLLIYSAARKLDAGQRVTRESAMAKLYASEVANFVTNKAVQIHGGYGYTKDFDAERFFREAKVTQIYEGTNEILRLIIARETLPPETFGTRK